jgi:hypothetical protein
MGKTARKDPYRRWANRRVTVMPRTILKPSCSLTYHALADEPTTLAAILSGATGIFDVWGDLTESHWPFMATTNYDAFVRDQLALGGDFWRGVSVFAKDHDLPVTVHPAQQRLFDPDADK